MRRKPTGRGASMPSGRLRIAFLAAVVAAFFVVPVAQAAAGTIKVETNGTGAGHVKEITIYTSSEPAPINCPSTCEGTITNEEFSALAAIPNAGSEFVGWTITKGSAGLYCDGSEEEKQAAKELGEEFPEYAGAEGECFAEEAGGVTIAATFNSTGIPLKVTHEGAGGGTIQSSPAGITCTSGECEGSFPENETVTLTASPAPGSLFTAWKNCDSTTVIPGVTGAHGRQCTIKLTPGHKTVGAKFEPAYTVTVKSKGNGTGSISGVTCGNNCTEASGIFLASKSVTLKPKPYTKTSEFKGWTGCPEVIETVNCKVSSEATVEAEFAEMARENLKVTKTGNGQGTVKSSPAGINCSYTCPTNTAYFYKGATVTLTASVQAEKGSTLGNWGGACSGTAATPCVVTMSEAKSVTVGFN